MVVSNKQAVRKFVNEWIDKGYEKGETQRFWLDLLHNVFGIDDPTKIMRFEIPVKTITKEKGADFIDAYITSTKVLIEQKGSHIDLSAKARQSDGTELTPYQQARRYAEGLPLSQKPRWIVACNFANFEIHDMEQPNNAPEIVRLADLEKEYHRLAFLVNDANAHIKKEFEVSIKAGEIVGVLYDKILAQYKDPDNAESQKALNKLCVRLVFCLYAEDAGVFGGKNMFHDYMAQFSTTDFRSKLIELFHVLDTKPEDRDPYMDEKLAAFPYVNGGMFSGEIEIPRINEEIRSLILQRASDDFDWSQISPTIFGAVFESTLNPDTRRAGGMHYTSIENIHKVIDPLFLDDLKNELAKIKSVAVAKARREKAIAFQNKLASLKFLDPACGSGNFLTESYTSLRRLENEVLRILYGDNRVIGEIADPIKVGINQFYGIEINDFACSVAQTALWIAESQMMIETDEIVGFNLDPLPLKRYTNIREGNALRMDWTTFGPQTPSSAVIPTSAEITDDNAIRMLSLYGPQTPSSAEITSEIQSSAKIEGFHSRGYLPHIELKQFQFITFRLHDSVPAEVIRQWKEELKIVETTDSSDPRCVKLRQLVEQYADKGYGECFLKDERIASMLERTLKFHDGIRYNLVRWCIMPNHVHILVEMKEGWSLSTILQEWKSVSAHKANKILGRNGDFWQPEYFDRYIRDDAHFNNVVDYIDANPVKANLVEDCSDWRWCSLGSEGGNGNECYSTAGGGFADEGVRVPEDGVRVPEDGVRVPNESDYEVENVRFDYIMGNPPFLGARVMSAEQKDDLIAVFGAKWENIGNMDYVTGWYKKAADLMRWTPNLHAAFVSTNSVTQGEQVANLWKPLMEKGVNIDFAWRTFIWNSESNQKAHVHCVIVGFSRDNAEKTRRIFDGSSVITASNINGYLIDGENVFVESCQHPICDVPEIGIGNKPIDGGFYLFKDDEKEEFVKKEPEAEKFFKRWYGSDEFINRRPRWCLWLGDANPVELIKLPECMKRIESVRQYRLASSSAGTVKLADRPTRFHVENMPKSNYLLIPEVSSEKRPYIPIGFMTPDILCSNLVKLVPNATLYHFGILTSSVHNAWMRAVAGRLEMRYRYSKDIVYNNFPWPAVSKEQEKKIEKTAQSILEARNIYSEASYADMYGNMILFPELMKAHHANDAAVLEAYGFSKDATESEIVARLFRMYQELTGKER